MQRQHQNGKVGHDVDRPGRELVLGDVGLAAAALVERAQPGLLPGRALEDNQEGADDVGDQDGPDEEVADPVHG